MRVPAERLPLERMRTYRLCRLLHCVPSALDGESAVDLDWLLAIHDEVSAAEQRQAEKANGKGH